MTQYVFKLPDVGEGTAEAEISAWRVSVGDTIKEDDPLVDIMTDKATVEIPSPVSGTVVSIHGEPGQMMPVGSQIVVIELSSTASNSSATASPKPSRAEAHRPTPVERTAPAKDFASSPEAVTVAPAEDRLSLPTRNSVPPAASPILASPAVRKKAWDNGVALQFVKGSGPAGRIRHEDLDAYLAGSSGNSGSPHRQQKTGTTETKVVGLRRKIAERMQLSKRSIPHYSYIEEIDVTALEALRSELNTTITAARPKLTFLPFLIRALTIAIAEYPQINSNYDDASGTLRTFDALHAGIATQTPGGLLVPVLRHAESMGIWEIAATVSDLASRARSNNCSRDELNGSTLTITSLGALGGISTTPVINHPEVAIIGVNKIVERAVVRDGNIVARKIMNLSSSFDHRIVDGSDAASFIQLVRQRLEQPATLFLGAEQ